MALLWMEGFDDLATADIDLLTTYNGRWSSLNAPGGSQDATIQAGTRVGTGKEWYCGTYDFDISTYFEKTISGSPATIIVGMAVKIPSLSPIQSDADRSYLFSLYNASAGYVGGMRVNGSGQLVWDIDTNGTTTPGVFTSTGTLAAGTWHYVEAKITVNSTTGAVYTQIDGVDAGSATSIDTNASGVDNVGKVRFFNGNVNHFSIHEASFDDLYIADTTGTANNDFLGPVEVTTVMPTAEGSAIQWTPSTGTDNSALVDEIPANEDTDYVSTSTATNQDLYDCANLANTDTIKGVLVSARVRDETASGATLKVIAKSGTTTSNPSGKGTSTSYQTVQEMYELNPDTSAAWTETNFNSAEFGIELA